MKVILDHKYLSIEALTHEHADTVPGGSEQGDLHYKRTKVDIKIKGSINPGGLDSVASTLLPIIAQGLTGAGTVIKDPLKPPRIVDCEEELAQDIQDLAEAARHDLGMTYTQFARMFTDAAIRTWPVPSRDDQDDQDEQDEHAPPPA